MIKLESLFGVQGEIRAHQLENELFSLSPSSFDSIEGFFTKLKSRFIFLKKCGIENKEDQFILSILSKLGPKYSFFVSTFHATRFVITNWKIPSLSTLFDSLAKEKYKLIQKGTIKTSKVKYYSLTVQGSTNAKSKEKEKVKEMKSKLDDEDEGSKPTNEGSNSMKKFKKKGSSSKCSYCRKWFPSNNKCFKKKMDIMSKLLEKHNIEVPNELEKHVETTKHCHIV